MVDGNISTFRKALITAAFFVLMMGITSLTNKAMAGGGFGLPVGHVSCNPDYVVGKYIEGMKQSYPTAEAFTLNAEDRITFLGWFNNIPPVSDANPDHVIIFARPTDDIVYAGFVDKGCITSMNKVRMGDVLKFLPIGLEA